MKMVFYWTDCLVFIFLFLSLFFIIIKRRSPLFQAIKHNLFTQSRYLVAFLVVVFFIFVGFIDSIHFKRAKESHQIESVLDVLLSPRNVQHEKTYSAPFALKSFIPELIKNEQDQIIESYPPLKFIGENAKSAAHQGLFILKRVGLGLLMGLIITAVFYLFKTYFLKIKMNVRSSIKRTFWISIFFLLSLICIVFLLLFEYHIFGTDKVGRDVFYIALKSIRTGLVIGCVTLLVMLPFALSLGMISGYYSGTIDDIIQYVYTTLGSIPGVLLIAAAVISFQVKIEEDPDLKLLMLCVILGATGWIGLCRLLRGETLKLKEAEFVQAAKVLGVSNLKILFKHILPNLMHIVIISIVLEFSGLVLAEAVLSYIGVGVSSTTLSWGNMINAARLEMAREPMVWWSLSAAFVFMFSLVFATNVLGDAIQKALDPKQI